MGQPRNLKLLRLTVCGASDMSRMRSAVSALSALPGVDHAYGVLEESAIRAVCDVDALEIAQLRTALNAVCCHLESHAIEGVGKETDRISGREPRRAPAVVVHPADARGRAAI
jgi:hypothetical protein